MISARGVLILLRTPMTHHRQASHFSDMDCRYRRAIPSTGCLSRACSRSQLWSASQTTSLVLWQSLGAAILYRPYTMMAPGSRLTPTLKACHDSCVTSTQALVLFLQSSGAVHLDGVFHTFHLLSACCSHCQLKVAYRQMTLQ